MVNLDVYGILAVILVSCINGAPTDILWNKEVVSQCKILLFFKMYFD